MDGYMPEPSWRAHIDLITVTGRNRRLDVLQRQVALPVGFSDRRVPTYMHFLKTLAMSEILNIKSLNIVDR